MATKLQKWAVEAIPLLTKQTGWKGVNLRYHVNEQAVGPCPFCPDHGTDRFVVYRDGNYWCRVCKQRGWWTDARLDAAELAAVRLVKDQERMAKQREIANCRDWQTYHTQVDIGVPLWESCGIDMADIKRWQLGYCPQAPCCDYPSASLTIPVFHHHRLVDIRHRLVTPADGQKYRSHWAGLPPSFFNIDSLPDGERIYVVEGEKKAIVLEHYGFHPTISYPGLNNADKLTHILAQEGTKSQLFVFLPDPGSESKLRPLLASLRQSGLRIGTVDLFKKPDDFLIQFGAEPMHDAVRYFRSF